MPAPTHSPLHASVPKPAPAPPIRGLVRWVPTAALAIGALAASPPAPTPTAAPVLKAVPASGKVYDAKLLTKPEYERLPDDAVIDVHGRPFTVRELRAKARQNASTLLAKRNAALASARTAADATRAKFLLGEKAKLETENARQRAEFTRVHDAWAATHKPGTGTLVPVTLPQITSAPASVQPGSFVFLHGRNFGSYPVGKVLLKGMPGGDLVLPFDPGALFPWMDEGIALNVPVDLPVFQSVAARFHVIRSDGKTAERAVQFVPPSDLDFADSAVLVSCGGDDTYHDCEPTAYGVSAGHTEDTFWETDAIGCDRWHLSLKNGWMIHDVQCINWSQGGGEVNCLLKGVPGSTSWDWQVCYFVPGQGPDSGNTAGYQYWIAIVGTKGTSWK